MSKNIIVNGKTYNGVSFLQLLTTEGASALFKDMDEVSSGGMPDLAEVTSGTFTVEAATMGSTDPGSTSYLAVAHGMSAAPDGFAVFPKYFYDTLDSNIFADVYSYGWNVAAGRRSVEQNTTHPICNDNLNLVDDVNIYPFGTGYGKFQPNYIDSEGNQGQQVYIWIAWRKAE